MTKTNAQTTPTALIDIKMVQSCLLDIRGQSVLLDRDVATLYGVQTREVNQAVRNNAEKFPQGYTFQLSEEEFKNWKSKILTSNLPEAEKFSVKMGVRKLPLAFTERGLYMLATILKGKVATQATLAIIETYAQVRAVKRELLELHKESDNRNSSEKMQRFGEAVADIVMPDLDTVETESTLELNFFIGKLKHSIKRVKHPSGECSRDNGIGA